MPKLLLIADDFTGVLDTSVRLSNEGISVRIIFSSGSNYGFDRNLEYDDIEKGLEIEKYIEEVIAVDMNSRHLYPSEAKALVKKYVQVAKKAGIEFFYKKTDSALRGNVGAELAGIIEAFGGDIGTDVFGVDTCGVTFVPAYPEANRIVSNGVLYVDGFPVAQSAFGEDPFNPVIQSSVAEIISTQTDVPVESISQSEYEKLSMPFSDSIRVVDATTTENIMQIGSCLHGSENAKYVAGCAGFAASLTSFMPLEKGDIKKLPLIDSLFIVAGSMHSRSIDQLNYGARIGFAVFTLSMEQKLDLSYLESADCESFIDEIVAELISSKRVIMRTVNTDSDREYLLNYAEANSINENDVLDRLLKNIGGITARIIEKVADCGLMVFGGDTLHSIVENINPTGIFPAVQVVDGVAASVMEVQGADRILITKSGGLGNEDVVEVVDKFIQNIDHI